MKEAIPIEQIGIIKKGDNAGWQVKVIDDSESSGGYLILIAKDFFDPSSEGFDDWVPDIKLLAGYFAESGWLVDWEHLFSAT